MCIGSHYCIPPLAFDLVCITSHLNMVHFIMFPSTCPHFKLVVGVYRLSFEHGSTYAAPIFCIVLVWQNLSFSADPHQELWRCDMFGN